MTRRKLIHGPLTYCFVVCAGISGCGGDTSPDSSIAVVSSSPPQPSLSSTPTQTPTPSASPPSSASVPSPEVTSLAGVLVQAGDSIGIGEGAGYWAAIDHLDLGPNVTVRNASVSGRTLLTGFEMRSADLFAYANPVKSSVLIIQQGTNDLGLSESRGSWLYDYVLAPFVASAHEAGFYVVVNTILPRSDWRWTSVKEAERQVYNAAVRINSAGADSVNDVASDSLIGDQQNPSRSGFYADGLHLNLQGQTRMATLAAEAVRPLLAKGKRP